MKLKLQAGRIVEKSKRRKKRWHEKLIKGLVNAEITKMKGK